MNHTFVKTGRLSFCFVSQILPHTHIHYQTFCFFVFYLIGSAHLPSFFLVPYQRISRLISGSLKFPFPYNGLPRHAFVESIILRHIKGFQKLSTRIFRLFPSRTRPSNEANFFPSFVPTIDILMHAFKCSTVPFFIGFLRNTKYNISTHTRPEAKIYAYPMFLRTHFVAFVLADNACYLKAEYHHFGVRKIFTWFDLKSCPKRKLNALRFF